MIAKMNGKSVYVSESEVKIGSRIRISEWGVDYPMYCTEISAEKTDDGKTVFLATFEGKRLDEKREYFLFFTKEAQK